MVTSHRKWYGFSKSRKRMSQYSTMTATCRLHTEILRCNIGHDIEWTVTHFKTLGTTELWCSVDRELLETHRWHFDAWSHIFTYSQLHKLINLYIIIITIFSIRYCHSHALRLYRIVFLMFLYLKRNVFVFCLQFHCYRWQFLLNTKYLTKIVPFYCAVPLQTVRMCPYDISS